MVWLNCQEAFNSVLHECLLVALKLAKIAFTCISAIETSHEGDIQSDAIHNPRGILQGDGHLVLLFILSVNPLSHLLKKRVPNWPSWQT